MNRPQAHDKISVDIAFVASEYSENNLKTFCEISVVSIYNTSE